MSPQRGHGEVDGARVGRGLHPGSARAGRGDARSSLWSARGELGVVRVGAQRGRRRLDRARLRRRLLATAWRRPSRSRRCQQAAAGDGDAAGGAARRHRRDGEREGAEHVRELLPHASDVVGAGAEPAQRGQRFRLHLGC